MVHLERTPMAEQDKFMKPWKRYIDCTITYIKSDFIRNVINSLNKFHENIKIIHEVENNVKVSFLNVLLLKSNGKLKTTVSCSK